MRNDGVLMYIFVFIAAALGTILGPKIFSFLLQGLPTKCHIATLACLLIPIFLYRIVSVRKPAIKELKRSKVSSSGLHALEAKYLSDSSCKNPFTTAVQERRKAYNLMESKESEGTKELEEFYGKVYGKCCESVIGVLWMPIGIVGPIPLVRGTRSQSQSKTQTRFVNVPLVTVEGALLASVNRGCKALRRAYEKSSDNLECLVSKGHRKGITRGPSFRASSIAKAAEFLDYLHDPARFDEFKRIFEGSSPGGHVTLIEIRGRQIGRFVYVRVRSDTSSAMGMNMISRACSVLFKSILVLFKGSVEMESLSGNYCVDKKPAGINWIEGRGREVIASVRLDHQLLDEIFSIKGEDEIKALVRMSTTKNLIGSAAAGSIGGFNSQVANVAAAFYLATGQDVAQIVDASQGLTFLEYITEEGEEGGAYLLATLTLPCIEVGIIGGGTRLPHQLSNLKIILGSEEAKDYESHNNDGLNYSPSSCDDLARCLALTALAGELSLLAALKNDTLLSSHFKLNH